jgi:aldehyde dehydrogenase (NAD(P)+)
LNSSDESDIASVYAATEEDVDRAVSAAHDAFRHPSWRDLNGTERGDLLYKLASLIREHKEVLATIETWDNGSVTINQSYVCILTEAGRETVQRSIRRRP